MYVGYRVSQFVELQAGPSLIDAVSSGDRELVQRLIRLGVEVNGSNGYLRSLHAAAFYGELQVMEILIQHGADLEKLNACGWVPIEFAAGQGHQRRYVVDFLRERGAKPTLMDAILLGEADVVEKLMTEDPSLVVSGPQCKPWVNIPFLCDLGGNKPRRIATTFPRTGADADWIIQYYLRGFRFSAEVLALLFEYETKPTNTWRGKTLLHAGVELSDAKACRVLLGHGVDPEARNSQGLTALELAIERGMGCGGGVVRWENRAGGVARQGTGHGGRRLKDGNFGSRVFLPGPSLGV